MKATAPLHIKSIAQYHKLRGLPAPEHPLISVVNYADMRATGVDESGGLLFDFYLISAKKGVNGKIRYGQTEYDHDEGILSFMAPHQLLKLDKDAMPAINRSGWMLLIHPDFLWNTPLAKTIRQFDFFDYAVNEALFVSEKEEAALAALVQTIKNEYAGNVDRFSQNIMIAQVETLLQYAERFYHRQFLTRKKPGHQLLSNMEDELAKWFKESNPGLPTVQWLAEQLHVSPGYLGATLKTLTGMNTQQHIHDKLIEKAKEKLSTTRLSVSEIAYELGFEHTQSFSKLFKSKTQLTPLAFRNSFN